MLKKIIKLFEVKTINSIKEIEKKRSEELLFYRVYLFITFLSGIISIGYPTFLGITILLATLTIISNQDLRYWDVKKHLLARTKAEK